MSARQLKNFIKSQDFYKGMNMLGKGSINAAMYLKGLKKGGKLNKAQGGYNFEYPDLGFELPEGGASRRGFFIMKTEVL